MSKLVIDSGKSLYKPIEIQIDGTTYLVARLNKAVFDKLKSFEDAARGGDLEALFQQLQALVPKLNGGTLAKLDVRDVQRIINFITDSVLKADKVISETEKNVSRPGAAKSP